MVLLRRLLLAAVICSGVAVVPAHAAATAPPASPSRAAAILRALGARAPHATRAHPRRRADLIAELARIYPRLTGTLRRQAARFLARPTDGAADPNQNGYTVPEAPGSPYCTADYCVHWVGTPPDAPDLTDANANGIPDHVEQVAAVAENAHGVENGTLGWRPPKSDGTRGGGLPDHTDIYLSQLGGTGVYGYTAPDPGQRPSHSLFSYMVIDNDFAPAEFPSYASPEVPLDVTVAHEYNHVLHYTYDALEDTWMFESTAVWMEDQVYDDLNDYFQYLPGWVQLTGVPITRFNGTNPNDRTNIKVYGSAIWNHWLTARYGPTVVRAAWERSVAAKSFAPGAFGAAIRQHGGRGFSDEFSRFVAATAEWQAANSGFPEGASYPDVPRVATLAVDGPGGVVELDHTAFAAIGVTGGGAGAIKLGAVVPAGVDGAIALVGRSGPAVGGTQVTSLAEARRGGPVSVTLENPAQFARVTAVVVNADVSYRGFDRKLGDWKFTADHEPFLVAASTDFEPPRVVRIAPRRVAPGAPRVTVTFSEPVIGVSSRSLRLVGPGGSAVPARVRFRPGSTTAVLIPRRALRPHTRYRVRLGSQITDLALNPLGKAPAPGLRTR